MPRLKESYTTQIFIRRQSGNTNCQAYLITLGDPVQILFLEEQL